MLYASQSCHKNAHHCFTQAYQHKILWFKNSSRYNEDCVVSATIFVLGAALQIWIRTASEWGDVMQFSAYVKANQNVYFIDCFCFYLLHC